MSKVDGTQLIYIFMKPVGSILLRHESYIDNLNDWIPIISILDFLQKEQILVGHGRVIQELNRLLHRVFS